MMKSDRLLLVAAVVLLGGLLAFLVWEILRPVPAPARQSGARTVGQSERIPVPESPNNRKIRKIEQSGRVERVERANGSPIVKKADPNVEIIPDPPSTPEEIAAAKAEETERDYSEAISDVVSLYLNHDEKPNAEIAAEFKAEFDRMTPGQRVEHVHEALNLFDDDYLPLIEALALDAKEPAEMLEAVVYDLGNRNEAKVRPIFEKLAAHPTHPCRAAAAEWLADRAE